jgi:hypothetical protein
MAGGLRGAATNIQRYVEENLAAAAKADEIGKKSPRVPGTEGRGRARKPVSEPVRPADWENTAAEELHEMLQTVTGQEKFRGMTAKTKGVIRRRLYEQNKLWGQQFDHVAFGVKPKDFDPAKDAPKATTAPEEPGKRGGNDEYDMPDRAMESVRKKVEVEGEKNEKRDVAKTGRALENVTDARRRAEGGTRPNDINRRTRRNPGPAGAGPLDINPPLDRGGWRGTGREPRGSEVIAGGDDGSKALPVAPRTTEIGTPDEEVILREPEIDANDLDPPKTKARTITIDRPVPLRPISETSLKPETRARDSRIGKIGGPQSDGYLSRITNLVIDERRGTAAPYDFTFRGKNGAVEVKAGDKMTSAQVRQLLKDDPDLFKNDTAGGLYDRGKVWNAEQAANVDGTGRRRVYGDDDNLLKKGIVPGTKEQIRNAVPDSVRRMNTAADAAGFNPNAAESAKRLSPDEVEEARIDHGKTYNRTGGSSTQSPTDRFAAAQQATVKVYPKEGESFLQAISSADTDDEAYEIAYRIGEAIADRDLAGPKVSRTANNDAVHGVAQALVAGYGRRTPNKMPQYVEDADVAAIRGDSDRTPVSMPPVEPGPSPSLPDFLRDRARSRADQRLKARPGPKQGATVSQPGDEFPLRESSPSSSVDKGTVQPLEGASASVGSTEAPVTKPLPPITTAPARTQTSGGGRKPPRTKVAAAPADGDGDEVIRDPNAELAPVPPPTGRQRRPGQPAVQPPKSEMKAAAGRDDGTTVESRQEAVRGGWSPEERALRGTDRDVGMSQFADELRGTDNAGPTDADLMGIDPNGYDPGALAAVPPQSELAASVRRDQAARKPRKAAAPAAEPPPAAGAPPAAPPQKTPDAGHGQAGVRAGRGRQAAPVRPTAPPPASPPPSVPDNVVLGPGEDGGWAFRARGGAAMPAAPTAARADKSFQDFLNEIGYDDYHTPVYRDEAAMEDMAEGVRRMIGDGAGNASARDGFDSPEDFSDGAASPYDNPMIGESTPYDPNTGAASQFDNPLIGTSSPYDNPLIGSSSPFDPFAANIGRHSKFDPVLNARVGEHSPFTPRSPFQPAFIPWRGPEQPVSVTERALRTIRSGAGAAYRHPYRTAGGVGALGIGGLIINGAMQPAPDTLGDVMPSWEEDAPAVAPDVPAAAAPMMNEVDALRAIREARAQRSRAAMLRAQNSRVGRPGSIYSD